MDLLDKVRSSCQWVCSQSRYVHIQFDQLETYANALPLEEIKSPEHEQGSHLLGKGEDTAIFFIILDSINFGSGYFPHLDKIPGRSGYFTIATHLKNYFLSKGVITAKDLIEISSEDCIRIFKQRNDNAVISDLMNHFSKALHELGWFILQHYQGDFIQLIQSADQDAVKLIEELVKMSYFRDIQVYKGKEVVFLKRAQILAADLAIAFNYEGLGCFHNLNRLTIFADNLVPHVLKQDGVLYYDANLSQRIDQETLIEAGSEEEIEIRAAAVYVVEQLVNHLNNAGKNVNAMQLDYLLWNRGQQKRYKKDSPRHRTRTIFY